MDKFRKAVVDAVKKHVDFELDDSILEVPPDPKMGDYALPCFTFAKTMKKSPVQIAEELAKKVKLSELISKVEAKGPYLNFFVNKSMMGESVITSVAKEKENYGKGKHKKEKVMVEYHQPNTHKGFHVGHLRNAALGDSLIRIMRFSGYDVVAASYIGDIGAHVAKCLWFYIRKYKGKEPKDKRGEWLGEIYSEASRFVAEHPESEDEIKELQQKLENGDKNILELWEKTKKWSMDDFRAITKELGLNVDVQYFESEVEKPGKEIARKLQKKGIVEESDGALIIDMKKYGLDVFLVLKSDGTSLYSTKDFELARRKFEDYKIDKSIYVIGSEQKFYIKQLFKALELMGFKQAKKCYHLSYELVMLKEGKMSSREGNVVLYSHLRDEMMKKALQEVESRHKEWKKEEKEKSARAIAFGAMKFGMLIYDNNKSIIFDINKAMDFEGETGPYVQYAHARICSILRRHGGKLSHKVDFSLLKDESEKMLIDMIARFPEVINEASDNHKPNAVARYLLELSQAFNTFYHKCAILNEEEKLRDARLALADAVRQVIANGLGILGIEAPEQM